MLAMPRAKTNGIEIEYETFGDPADPALLLVMGLGAQLLRWDVEFCELLAERGYFVIRFDNRDAGLSTKIEDAPAPDVGAALRGDTRSAAYRLSDMAADCVGLLDHLGIRAAHVLGASMGGMIAQTLAIERPDRMLSLVSLMSTTGDRRVGGAAPAAMQVLLTPAPNDPERYVEHSVHAARVIGSPGFPFDEERLRSRAAATYARSFYPAGVGRQLVGIFASGDRTEQLTRVTVPTVVVHGADDPLVRVSGGEATAAAIPDAELVVVPGMGHDLPVEVWPTVADAVDRAAARAAAVPR